jgi:hypothetical protein
MTLTFLIGKMIFGGYWLMVAPVLFLPLGTVLLSWRVLRGIFRYLMLPLAIVFAAFGVTLVLTLPSPDAVTVLAGVLAVWSVAAAITFAARNRKPGWGVSQSLGTAKSSIAS